MTDLVFVVMGMGLDTNLKPAFFFNRSRHAASNCSLETFSGSPNRLPELSKAAASHVSSPHRRVSWSILLCTALSRFLRRAFRLISMIMKFRKTSIDPDSPAASITSHFRLMLYRSEERRVGKEDSS